MAYIFPWGITKQLSDLYYFKLCKTIVKNIAELLILNQFQADIAWQINEKE